jgi:hypothetical protein
VSAQYLTGRAEERADVLALLTRRQANAALVAARTPEFAELAADRARQLQVVIDDLRSELHVAEAGPPKIGLPA